MSQLAISRDKGDSFIFVRDRADEHVVTAASSVEDGHAISGTCRDAFASFSFQDDEDG
jgi:hypothetical protein